MSNEPENEVADYRTSHLDKGLGYDAYLAETPFDSYMDRWEKRHLVRMVGALFPQGIPRYLDFACGTGRITRVLAPFARESCGVDVSASMLEVARTKCLSTRFIRADLTNEEPDWEPFDLVTSFRFFGNAEYELRTLALGAINSALREGGYLILNNHRNPHSVMEVIRRLSGGQPEMDLDHFKLRELLREHGFAIRRRCPIGFWIFRGSLVGKRLSRPDAGRMLERLFGQSWTVPFAPDAILVTQKIGASPLARVSPFSTASILSGTAEIVEPA
jgi:SAM-dependent methyltransferase